MKKYLVIVSAAALFAVSCKGTESDKAETAVAQEVAEQKGATYTLDQANSTLKWTATHKGGLNPRYGNVIAQGTVSVLNNAITGGSFTMDMSHFSVDSASVAASEGKKAMDLENHLKSADFFEIEKYPTAKFEITNVGPLDTAQGKSVIAGATNSVSGNLTLKDKNINVTFPAKIVINDSVLTVESKFSIDRKEWGINYKTEGNPADWGISKDVDIELNIQARK